MSRAGVITVLLTLFWLCLSRVRCYYSLEVGDPCPTRDYRSSCQPSESCKTLKQLIESKKLSVESVLNCGYTTTDEKICCPLDADQVQMRSSPENTTATTTSTTTTASPPWLGIFNTNREYLQRSVAMVDSQSPHTIVFPTRSTRNDAACRAPLYEGDCLPVSKCGSIEILLRQQRLRDEDIYTCRPGTTEEIICCPISLPLQPRAQFGSATRVGFQLTPLEVSRQSNDLIPGVGQAAEVAANAVELLAHYKYLAALAYPNARFDGHVHRCTAVLLAPQLLLTSAGCGRPSHAVFGVADMRDVDEEEDDLVDIANISVYRQDLALMRLPQPHQGERASVCSYYEQARWLAKGHLVASGWAKGNASDCPLYELPMRLLPSAACKDIANSGGVQDLPSRHMCVEPMNLAAFRAANSSSDSCLPCPSAVGSVLHLQRAEDSRCVLGVATPTGDDCHAETMYFTSLVDRQLFKFVEDLRLMP